MTAVVQLRNYHNQVQQTATHEKEYCSFEATGHWKHRVYAMRYDSYVNGKYIDENSSHKFKDEFDDKANCTSYISLCGGEAMGSIRSCVYKPHLSHTIPVMEVFHNEIKEYVGFDRTLVEANKFIILPEYQRRGGAKARFTLYRNIINSALKSNAECIVIAVRTEHIRFYEMLKLAPISDEKSYPHLAFKTVLMASNGIEATKKIIWRKTDDETPLNGTVLNNSHHRPTRWLTGINQNPQ